MKPNKWLEQLHPHLSDIESCSKQTIIRALEDVAFKVLDEESELRKRAKAAHKRGNLSEWRRLNAAARQNKKFRDLLWFAFPPF